MNLELKNEMEAIINKYNKKIGELKSQYDQLNVDYKNHVEGVTASQINAIVREATEKRNARIEVEKDLAAYAKAAEDKKINYRNFILVENELAKKYGVELIDEFTAVEDETKTKVVEKEVVTPVVKVEQPKNHTIRDMILGALVVGAVTGVVSCVAKDNNVSNKVTTAQVEDESFGQRFENAYDSFIEKVTGIFSGKKQDAVPEGEVAEQIPAPTMETGDVQYSAEVNDEITAVYGHLTDASDEAQVMARAQAIYANHIDLPNVPAAMKAQLSLDTIANMIRMANGELSIEDGKPYYEMDLMDKLANDFASYYHATSFVQFGTNLQFAPVSVFFEEDTLAYASAKMHDQYVARIYQDIRNNAVEQFRQDSIAWGEFVRDTFVFNDFTGMTPSIWQMDTGSMFPVAAAIISVYAPSIEEYSLGVDLARRDGNNIYGDTFGICVPRCYNEHNELVEVPLSTLLYDINYTPMNSLAERAGRYEEWASTHAPITVNLWNNSNEYLTDKYEREVGFGRTLK